MGNQDSVFFQDATNTSKILRAIKCPFCSLTIPKHSAYSELFDHMQTCQIKNSLNFQQQQNDSTSAGTENEFELIFSCEETEEDAFDLNPLKTNSFEQKQLDLYNTILQIKNSRDFHPKLIYVPKDLPLRNQIELLEHANIFDNVMFTSNKDINTKDITSQIIGKANGEFFNRIIKELIHSNKSILFDRQQILEFDYRNKDDTSVFANLMKLLGKILAKCIFDNNFLLEEYFNLGILKQLVEENILSEDIYNISYEDYQRMNRLQNLETLKEENIYFTLEGTSNTIELIPGGKDIKVTKDNLSEYISKYYQLIASKYKMLSFHMKMTLYGYIPKDLITQFNAKEIERILNGSNYFSISEWKDYTQYHGVFSINHPTVKLLWNFLENKSQKFLHKILCILMNINEIPSGGLSALFDQKRFVISSILWDNQGKVTSMTVYRNPQNTILILIMPLFKSEDEIQLAFDSLFV